MKKWAMLFLVAMLALLLGGCFAAFNEGLEKTGDSMRQVADIKLKVAEFETCDDVTVGALRRRYHETDSATGWQMYCAEVWKRNGEIPMEVLE